MALIDANAIIRIILNDNEDMRDRAKDFIKSNPVLIRNEVMAEIVYVLTKVYKVSRVAVCQCIFSILRTKNISVESHEIMECAVDTFEESSLDFVDCLLYAYNFINNDNVFTFDKKLNKKIK